jgi:hypothetical protein
LDVLQGDQAGERFGWSVAGVGDVNGDLLLEVTVGANQNGTSEGHVYLITTPE